MRKILFLAAILAFSAATACAAQTNQQQAPSESKPENGIEDAVQEKTDSGSDSGSEIPPVGIGIGQTAPDFTLSLLGGGSVTLSELRGMPVLLNVFTTWCPPCQAEFPDLQAIHEEYAGRAAVLGVSAGESEADVDRYFGRNEYSYPIAYDPGNKIDADYKIEFIPQTWIIDADGVIAGYFAGAADYGTFKESLDKVVE